MVLRSIVRRLRFGEPIVVVSGLPRSGTSMAMRMLAAAGMPIVSDGQRTADEDNPQGYFEDERVKNLAQDHDPSWLRASRGKAIKIISWLLDSLPADNNYRIVFMNRNLHEVLASQAKMLARRGEASDSSDARMLEHFETHLVRMRRTLGARPGVELCELDYAAVLADPHRAAEQMAAFLGGALDVDAMARAVDPTLYRNRHVRS